MSCSETNYCKKEKMSNAGFLKNQAMNIAVCILFLMNTAIVLKRRYKPNEFAKSQMTKLKFQTNLKIQ
jgi:hypothetical protein